MQPIQVDLSLSKYAELAAQLEADYYNICDQFNTQLSESSRATLHTANGEFIQIRTKDSKPYHPIFSNIYGREISDTNRAFYFKRFYEICCFSRKLVNKVEQRLHLDKNFYLPLPSLTFSPIHSRNLSSIDFPLITNFFINSHALSNFSFSHLFSSFRFWFSYLSRIISSFR